MSQDDWGNLKRYAEENKNLKSPAPGEQRIVFMGNSITEAWKTVDSNFFKNDSYINRGISGQTTPQMLIRFQQDVIALKPSVVVILAGINDIAQNTGPITLRETFENIVSMQQQAKKNNIKVILCSVLPAYDFPWRKGLKPAEKIIKLNNMLSVYCKANNIVYVDYHSHMHDERNGLDKKYTIDGVHPILAGYKIMEALLDSGIKKVLQQK